ncbi:MAG: hypothetical protein IT381_32045 [Deltaproteobacteria bacterium]|nr:hypothetical protein [Deltaproteobacteria bacterium]
MRLFVAFAVVAAFSLGACKSNEKPIYLTCGDSAGKLVGEAGTKYRISCPQLCTNGSLWGSDPYTADSSVCKAAIHAGALKPAGGEATVIIKGGEPKFDGTTKNGVTSASWGKYDRTFTFD